MPERIVCRFCGSDRGIREFGRVTVEASRESRGVSRDESGKLIVRWGLIDDDLSCDDDFEPDGVSCRECGREEPGVEDLVGAPVLIEVGASVVCPDGLRATVATVDEPARRLTVEGWHEVFTFADVTLLAVAA